jgi:hypothetical protein
MSDPFVEAMARELEELQAQHPVIRVDIPIREAFSLIAELQIALRHPRNVGQARDVARRLKDGLASAFTTCPALSRAIQMGDNPHFDS